MKGIGQFFDKFKNSAVQEIQKRVIICDILKDETKQDIPIEKISIKNAVLTVNADQIIKSELFLKKHKILDKIKKQLPRMVITDIR